MRRASARTSLLPVATSTSSFAGEGAGVEDDPALGADPGLLHRAGQRHDAASAGKQVERVGAEVADLEQPRPGKREADRKPAHPVDHQAGAAEDVGGAQVGGADGDLHRRALALAVPAAALAHDECAALDPQVDGVERRDGPFGAGGWRLAGRHADVERRFHADAVEAGDGEAALAACAGTAAAVSRRKARKRVMIPPSRPFWLTQSLGCGSGAANVAAAVLAGLAARTAGDGDIARPVDAGPCGAGRLRLDIAATGDLCLGVGGLERRGVEVARSGDAIFGAPGLAGGDDRRPSRRS